MKDSQQQLVARIKRGSKYVYQAPEGEWFGVVMRKDSLGYEVRGNNNNYRFSDLAFGVRLESGEVIELKAR